MKIAVLLLLLLGAMTDGFGQKYLAETIRHKADSVIHVAAVETDPEKKFLTLLSLHTMKIQTFPSIYLETGRSLNRLALASGDQMLEANSWSLLGQGYRLSGNYSKGLECHLKAVELAERVKHEGLIALVYNELGHIYKDRQENDKALRLYKTSWRHADKSSIKALSSWPKMNIGAIYLAMEKPDSAIHFSLEALSDWQGSFIAGSLSYLSLNIAGGYSLKGDNTLAMKYFRDAERLAYQDSSIRYANQVYVGLADHYLRTKQIDSSIYYARQAVRVVQNSPFTFLSIRPAKLLAELFEETHSDSALKYLRIYSSANDSLFNTRTNQQLQMMEFEEEQRKFALELETTEYRNKIKVYVLLGALALFLIGGIYLLRSIRQKHRVNTLLSAQKEELQQALGQLKSTQAQLIQAEKMASLGELTAGIAHEIQNPLNFVNNFAEVNAELIDELQQELATLRLRSGQDVNTQSATDVAQTIKDNEEKIIFHGKRADGIVKSMLQHSRTSSGKKEQFDINELVDEYLRLAYHGCRARDKSFNATMHTSFDNTLDSITAVPQDIGRVLLNLMTNAFYAVAEKSRSATPPYQPQVIVTTRKNDKNAMITIEDNGTGISNTTLDKIFQPFFTTKPTGEGTGLGLSISYDIIKAHGGDISASSVAGQGTTFTITLPIHPK
jgi:two-component system NtrC family sensor kinase